MLLKAVFLELQYFYRGLCNMDFCWQVSTSVPNSVSVEIAEMTRKLERSQEDLNLVNQIFEESQGKQFVCDILHEEIVINLARCRTKAEMF